MIYRIKVFSRLTYKGLSPYKANLLRKYRRVLAHNLLTDRKVYYQQNNNSQFPKLFLDEAKSYAERVRRDIINGVNKKEIESYLYKKYSPKVKVSIKSQNNDFIKGFRRVENGAGEKIRTGEQTFGSAIDSVKNIGKAKKNPVPPKKFIEKTIPSKINQELYDPFKQVDGNYNPFNQNISNKKNFSNTFEEIKESIISHIPSKEIVATAIAKKIEEKYLNGETEYKKESREDIEYQDQPIRRNNITLRKPEIRYRKEEKEETPEIIHRSVMEYPDSEE